MVFKEMDVPNEFCWTTIISNYTESERWEEALCLFLDMICSSKSVKPSQFTLVAVLQACTRLPALNQGKQIHGYILKAGFELHSFVGSALISMYGMSPIKSDIYDASRVFSSMTERDIVSWSAIITTWEQHGRRDRCICIDGGSSWLFLCYYFLPRCPLYAHCMRGQLVIFYICLMVRDTIW
uniref:Pentatricopeptide repeat-containing protein n=1 Tax=Nelumbo nucifera TaxID=4432 RepID=A0A822YBA2_NELNU|nr:TPA_asm: hypothetical protein HUJ06_031050 [Nelumbo nucifera]